MAETLILGVILLKKRVNPYSFLHGFLLRLGPLDKFDSAFLEPGCDIHSVCRNAGDKDQVLFPR